MHSGFWMVAAFASAVLGMAWLALAMDVHWQQVQGSGTRDLTAAAVQTLRMLGSSALAVALVLCLQADVATMAVLVWMIALTLAAMAVAFILTWRPQLLRPLWPGDDRGDRGTRGA